MIPKEEVLNKFKKIYKTDQIIMKKALSNMIEVEIVSDYFKDLSFESRYMNLIQNIKVYYPEIYKKYYIRVKGLYTKEERG